MLSITGFLILGVTTASVFVPLLSEIIDAIQEKEGVYDSSQINDKASAAFNIAGSIGTIVGPILGGALDDLVKFRSTCDIFSASAAILGVIYFLVGILPPLFQKKKEKKIDEENKENKGAADKSVSIWSDHHKVPLLGKSYLEVSNLSAN